VGSQFVLRFAPNIWLGVHNLPDHIFEFCVELLAVPKLAAKSPILRAKLVSVLSHIVDRKNGEIEQNVPSGHPSAFGQQLTYMLHSSQRTKEVLGAGLVQLFMDVDIVEGLDVDKESFDKYNVRRACSVLLQEFWDNDEWKRHFLVFVGEHESVYLRFCGALLNDTGHLLEDSLGRLVDIRLIEKAKEDTAAWDAQDDEAKQDRENFYRSLGQTGRGYLQLSNTLLDQLSLLGQEAATGKPFVTSHLGRLAGMFNKLLDLLCGPKRSQLIVKDPAQYGFSPKDLLSKITRIMVLFNHGPAALAGIGIGTGQNINIGPLVEAVADNLDFSGDVVSGALEIVRRTGALDATQLRQFEEFVALTTARAAAMNPNPSIGGGVGGVVGLDGDDDASMSGDPRDGKAETPTPAERNVDVDASLDISGLNRRYSDLLTDTVFEDFSFGSVDGDQTDPKSWRHHYADNIVSHVPGASASDREKMGRLQREFQTLAEQLLPLTGEAGIFIRYDEDRMDVVKALVVGPPGTPYAGGLFEFHIYFPPTYPHDPPLVNLETTGNGTTRFNPNLYNCGKVCLSLLGTWHGGSAVEKWSATKSSLFQVLVSIQGLIMIDEPYFNEPAYEAQRGTPEGANRSFEYNEPLRLGTLRHAVVNQLRQPAEGFAEVIPIHFQVQRARILAIAHQWLREASPDFRAKMARAVAEVEAELAKLPPLDEEMDD
jgi:ubiquitin-protein ligase